MPPKMVIKRDICGKCEKTVYPEEAIEGAGKKWHKGLCFRCHHDAGCSITLDLKNFFAFEGKVYCKTHCPKPKATVVSDDVMTEHIRNAPKKASEGLGTAHKGAPGSERKAAPGSSVAAAPVAAAVIAAPAAAAVVEEVYAAPEEVAQEVPAEPEAVPEPAPEEVPQEVPQEAYEQPAEPAPEEYAPPAEEVPAE